MEKTEQLSRLIHLIQDAFEKGEAPESIGLTEENFSDYLYDLRLCEPAQKYLPPFMLFVLDEPPGESRVIWEVSDLLNMLDVQGDNKPDIKHEDISIEFLRKKNSRICLSHKSLLSANGWITFGMSI